jgi:hypothetical protein
MPRSPQARHSTQKHVLHCLLSVLLRPVYTNGPFEHILVQKGDYCVHPRCRVVFLGYSCLEFFLSCPHSLACFHVLRRSSPPAPCLCVHARALFASCPVSLCPTSELFYSSIEQGSDHLNYRRNTLNTLFRPRITSLCHDVCDTLMSRFSALAP